MNTPNPKVTIEKTKSNLAILKTAIETEMLANIDLLGIKSDFDEFEVNKYYDILSNTNLDQIKEYINNINKILDDKLDSLINSMKDNTPKNYIYRYDCRSEDSIDSGDEPDDIYDSDILTKLKDNITILETNRNNSIINIKKYIAYIENTKLDISMIKVSINSINNILNTTEYKKTNTKLTEINSIIADIDSKINNLTIIKTKISIIKADLASFSIIKASISDINTRNLNNKKIDNNTC